jgi:hypothetical protein
LIKIYRKESNVDKKSPYKVFVNNMELTTIMDGETKDYDFKAGAYKFKVVGAGFHSSEVSLELFDNQIIQLMCYPSYKDSSFSRFIYKYFFRGAGIYFKIDKDFYL